MEVRMAAVEPPVAAADRRAAGAAEEINPAYSPLG